jgi:hypothetical protein
MFTNTTTVSTFALTRTLSAAYPTLFNVVPALNYNIVTNNKIIVNYPAPRVVGNLNVFVFNEAGYSSIYPADIAVVPLP